MMRRKSNLWIRETILCGVLFTYSFAFASLFHQLPGLYGDDGINAVNILENDEEEQANLQTFFRKPTLVLFSKLLGLSRYKALELICFSGLILSCLAIAIQYLRIKLTFFFLYLLYLSCIHVGGLFLWYQWDILLLEVGFAVIFLAPYLNRRRNVPGNADEISFWLIKWIFFRLIFSSGAVKLLSECPSWWSLSALAIHYQGECIPTPLAWYAHHLPRWVHKFSAVSTFFIMLICTPVVFFPFQNLRIIAFVFQVLIQVFIMMTGNFNFMNILTIVLCFVHLVDVAPRRHERRRNEKGASFWSHLKTCVNVILGGFIVALAVYQALCVYFGLTFTAQPFNIDFNIKFTYAAFARFVEVSLMVFIFIAYVSFFNSAMSCIFKSVSAEVGFKRVLNGLNICITIIGVFTLFTFSLVPLSSISPTLNALIPRNLHDAERGISQFHLVNRYGLFARMTGQNGRDELIIEGSDDQVIWKKYEFLYKPGDLYTAPPFIAPHQPRLDWQMWFAALSRAEKEYWYLKFIYRLLNGSEDVANLMKSGPFGSRPPKYIRALLYKYHYTDYHTKDNKWWDRKLVRVWHYAVALTDEVFQDFASKVNKTKEQECSMNIIVQLLDRVRSFSRRVDAFQFTVLPAFTAFIVAKVNSLIFFDKKPTQPKSSKRKR